MVAIVIVIVSTHHHHHRVRACVRARHLILALGGSSGPPLTIPRNVSNAIEIAIYKNLLQKLLGHPTFDVAGISLTTAGGLGNNLLHDFALIHGGAPLLEMTLQFIVDKTTAQRHPSSRHLHLCSVCCDMLAQKNEFSGRTPLLLAAAVHGVQSPSVVLLQRFDQEWCESNASGLEDIFGTSLASVCGTILGSQILPFVCCTACGHAFSHFG